VEGKRNFEIVDVPQDDFMKPIEDCALKAISSMRSESFLVEEQMRRRRASPPTTFSTVAASAPASASPRKVSP
jgi:hypothetical protein